MAAISVTVPRLSGSHPPAGRPGAINGLPRRAHSTRRLKQITRDTVCYRGGNLHGRFSMASAQYYDVIVLCENRVSVANQARVSHSELHKHWGTICVSQNSKERTQRPARSHELSLLSAEKGCDLAFSAETRHRSQPIPVGALATPPLAPNRPPCAVSVSSV